jgi:hypothetical protein
MPTEEESMNMEFLREPKKRIDRYRTTFIGDGVYARFENYSIELTTQRGDVLHTIYLDSHTAFRLMRYIEECYVPVDPCEHSFVRTEGDMVRCRRCNARWMRLSK